MGLPTKLTHEEQALLNKFAFLKKKRKNPSQKSLENTTNTSASTSISPVRKEFLTEKSPQKKPAINPKDAKEKAKLLLAAGRLKISKENENRSFKRAKTCTTDKKQNKTSSLVEEAFSNRTESKNTNSVKKESYSNFVAAGSKDTESRNEPRQANNIQERQQSNLFVSGFGLTKTIMDSYFPQYGPIKNIYFDQDKGHGYVTYQRHESAEKAIAELHGELLQGVTLKVAYARKRPYDDNRFTYRPRGQDADLDGRRNRRKSDESSSTSKESSKKPEVRGKRKLVKYEMEDEFDF